MEHNDSGAGARMRDYAVAFVGDNALHEVDWVFIEQDEMLVFVIKEEAVSPQTLADAWAVFRQMTLEPERAAA